MKKHILIGIPCILLHLISVGVLWYGMDAWARYSAIEEIAKDLKPFAMPEHVKEEITTMKSRDKAITIVSGLLEGAEKELSTRYKFESDVITGAKDRFLVFAYIGGICTLLSVVLIAGLTPLFRKGSNH